MRILLDTYERIRLESPHLPPGTLVLEHGFLTDRTQRARAVRLGVWVTVQHALLYGLAGSLSTLWGPERTRRVMPVKAWLDEGGTLSAGTDYPIGFYEPIRTVWGMVTRQTREAGAEGPEYAIDVYTAVFLSTAAGAYLNGESDRVGSLEPGKLADIVAFREDPMSCPVEKLADLRPTFTMVGGRAVHDPEGLFSHGSTRRGGSTPRRGGTVMREDGIVSIASGNPVEETVTKILGLLHAKGIRLFAQIDHSGKAEKARMHMRPTKLLIFGNPKAGTPLMIASSTAAIDLPLKMLIWEDRDGKVLVSDNSLEYLQARHSLPHELMKSLQVVEALAAEAAR